MQPFPAQVVSRRTEAHNRVALFADQDFGGASNHFEAARRADDHDHDGVARSRSVQPGMQLLVGEDREDEDLARAIEISLAESRNVRGSNTNERASSMALEISRAAFVGHGPHGERLGRYPDSRLGDGYFDSRDGKTDLFCDLPTHVPVSSKNRFGYGERKLQCCTEQVSNIHIMSHKYTLYTTKVSFLCLHLYQIHAKVARKGAGDVGIIMREI